MKPAKESVSGRGDAPAAETHKKKSLSPAVECLLRWGATALAAWLLLTFVIGVYVCHSDACSPMVKDGDLCIAWRIGVPSAGDLIFYRHDGQMRFGRVAAVAGDQVDVKDSTVWVNGYVAVQETSANVTVDTSSVRFPYTVPDESLFVLCDNRADNGDSRTYGAISLADCRGKVIFLMRRRGI